MGKHESCYYKCFRGQISAQQFEMNIANNLSTGGSVRVPAAASGTYGYGLFLPCIVPSLTWTPSNRPSQGLMTMDGALPLSEALDTAGVFSRNPIKWIIFAKAW